MVAVILTGLIVALVLELTGLVLAAVGFKRTWTEHAPDQDFWAPEKRRLRNAARRGQETVRRLLRRPGRPVNLEVQSAIHLTSSMTARVTTAWKSLPDPAENLQTFAATVHERLNRLHAMIQDDQEALNDERRARTDGEAKLRAELTELAALVDAKTANVAVGGLRLQALGWSFLLLGIVLGAIVNVIDRLSQG